MIKSFKCRESERLFAGGNPRRFRGIRAQAERKLALLDAATSLAFLASLPGNRLERLQADRAGQWSIRIYRQWRICLRFENGDAYEVEIVDYH